MPTPSKGWIVPALSTISATAAVGALVTVGVYKERVDALTIDVEEVRSLSDVRVKMAVLENELNHLIYRVTKLEDTL